MRATPALAAFALAAAFGPAPAKTAEPVRNVVFLAEDRPVFLRLRLMSGVQPFDAAWPDSIRPIHACLDRDGDGKLTTKEADKDALAAMVEARRAPPAAPLGDLDSRPKDGVVSLDELAVTLRPTIGPFRVQIGRFATSRTDALFDQLDRDKDGQLTRRKLSGITGSLRRLDLDDNEMISADELEPFNDVAAAARVEIATERKARLTSVPPVLELVESESSLRIARMLLKKYDTGKGDTSGKPDGKLSASEFAIDSDSFAAADTDHDGRLNTEELRRYVMNGPVDLVLDVTFPPGASGRPTVEIGGGIAPKGVQIKQLDDGDVEFAVGRVRLDLHVDAGENAAENARQVMSRRFRIADLNKNGYLEVKELTAENAAGLPLAGLTGIIDRDGDGKLYANELNAFVDRQLEAARGRLVLTTSDLGRAIFGILDLNRDRRLGARELSRTVERVLSWDADGDGCVTADEIPYHFRVTIGRGELFGLSGQAPAGTVAIRSMTMTGSAPTGTATSPDWFRLMDRNVDGDVSRREFLGPREQFDRLDRDKDGLIDPSEAETAGTSAKAGEVRPRP